VTPSLARHFHYAAERGAAVQSVVPDSPAADAGLRGGRDETEYEGVPFQPGGDLIVAIDGQRVQTAEDVVRMIAERLLPGQTTRLTILRGSKRMVVPVKLAERPTKPPASR
jgi:2-alkenal reductase